MHELEQKMRARHDANRFMVHNFAELESVEPDRAVVKLEIRDESKNPAGMVHGGALFTMADNAAGTAVHTDGRHYVTQTSSFHFFNNQREGTIRARAVVKHRGKSTAMAAVEIVGTNEKLLASGEFVFFCVDQARMEARGRQK